jgi:acetolactate synthase I/III small subunit
MTSEKAGTATETAPKEEKAVTPETQLVSVERAGLSDAPAGAVRTHTLVITVRERPGSVDRVVGLLRRRRANMHTLTIGRSEQPDVARITAVIDDSSVAAGQLVEQIRKVVDVRQVLNLSAEQMVERELALIKVTNDPQRTSEIIELGHQFGARIADVTIETVMLEITNNTEQVEKLLNLLQPFGIREVARTGSVAMPRGTTIGA